ncbi:unnamed protein product [Clonostachys rosea]|uniref:Glycerate dehydrogenase n=1 Tax=Bionectria ochroleuca TaxID=29856 RepID=A0ABY6TQW2_BIOOC|nr:unnamed protein product [Clonostachys rosea]
MAFPSPTHFNIVALETVFTPMPELMVPAPHTFALTEHQKTKIEQIPERIKDADIVITTTIALSANTLSAESCPKLKLVIALAAGTDSIDRAACKARGILVLNSPDCNSDSVAEHGLAMYFALRRSILPSMAELRAGSWPQRGTLMYSVYAADEPPRSCKNETAVVIGYGNVGRKAVKLLQQVGMEVIIAGRKGVYPVQDGRTDFEEAIKKATVIVLCCPRSPETLDLLTEREFTMMRRDALLINLSRGGVVSEHQLLAALRGGLIAGAAVDVFEKEPASPQTSPLLSADIEPHLNLVTTPHTAWIGQETTSNYQVMLQNNLNAFVLGQISVDK